MSVLVECCECISFYQHWRESRAKQTSELRNCCIRLRNSAAANVEVADRQTNNFIENSIEADIENSKEASGLVEMEVALAATVQPKRDFDPYCCWCLSARC